MGDFLTRLSERTLGTVSVAQPLIAPMFAPETATSEWDSEAPAVRSPSARPTQPPRHEPTGRREVQGNVAPTTSKRRQEMPDTGSDPHPPGEARSSEVTFRQEDRRDPAPVESPRRMPESSHLGMSERPERETSSEKEERREPFQPTARHPEAPTEPLRRADLPPPGAISTSQDVLPESSPVSPSSAEGESGQVVFRPVRTLVDQGGVSGSRPSPETQAASDSAELGPRATPAPPEPSDVPHQITPHVVPPRLENYPERGSREQRVAASEEPTIRVAIGRIEVRAVTPPPAPRPTPARPGPSLSLDAYLQQRNGGRR